MDEKKKIQKVAHGFNIGIKIVRILCLVGVGICITSAIVLFILGGTGAVTKIYENNQEILSDVNIDLQSKLGVFISYNEVPLSTIYEAGDLNMLMYGCGALCIAGAIEALVMYFILIFFKRVFVRLQTTETPFTPEFAKDIKIAFILISILVTLYSVLIGFIVAGLLACMYVMFLYGCRLQKNEDETL